MSNLSWKTISTKLHNAIIAFMLFPAMFSVRRFRWILCLVPVLSVVTLALGFFLNFRLQTDKVLLWTPKGSNALLHGSWLRKESGIRDTYPIHLLIHANGENVLEKDGIDMAFRAVDMFKTTEGFDSVCMKNGTVNTLAYKSYPLDTSKAQRCSIVGITNFFNDDYEEFLRSATSNDKLIDVVSSPYFRNGDLVNRAELFGHLLESEDGKMLRADSFPIRIGIPPFSAAEAFEKQVVDNILQLRHELKQSGTPFQIETVSLASYNREFENAIVNDAPLLLVVIFVMTIFSCSVFFRFDRIRSSCLFLGVGSLLTVTLGLVTAFGFLFLFGPPLNILSATIPFVIFGIGLDDAFIITGAFERTSTTLSVEERVVETIQDCGVSIMLTTITTSLASFLGITSSVPAVRSFYIYAGACVLMDFAYQITFFIALIVANEERKHQNRYDVFPCFKSTSADENVLHPGDQSNLSQKVMELYCRLLKEKGKCVCISISLVFCALTVFCAISASRLRVAFDVTQMLSESSHVREFVDSLKYTSGDVYGSAVYFRDVDFSQSSIRNEMVTFVHELAELPYTETKPHFWLDAFNDFVESNNNRTDNTFDENLDVFFEDDYNQQLYSHQVTRNMDGTIKVSTVPLSLPNLDLEDTKQQVDFLASQRRISSNAKINYGLEAQEWKFFTFSNDYYMFSFFSVAVHELILTTILGLCSITVVVLCVIPDLSAVKVVLPTVAMIYVDVLGIVQWAGYTINPVTYVSIIMSLGLLVDYVLHIVFKYYESKKSTNIDKVEDCLTTVGTSVLIGGLSTVLSTLPLVFSTCLIFKSIFVIFFSFVTLSLLHGLVFVPAVLILFGRKDENLSDDDEHENLSNDDEQNL